MGLHENHYWRRLNELMINEAFLLKREMITRIKDSWYDYIWAESWVAIEKGRWTLLCAGLEELIDKHAFWYFISANDAFRVDVISLPLFCKSIFNACSWLSEIFGCSIFLSASIYKYWAYASFILFSCFPWTGQIFFVNPFIFHQVFVPPVFLFLFRFCIFFL